MNKQTIQKNMEQHLSKWKNEINHLESTANELKAESRKQFENQMGVLRKQWQQAQTSLRQMDDAGEETWNKAKVQLEQIFKNMENIYSRAVQMAGDSLGWPEGLAKKRARNSEGWAEGFGEQPANSHGWSEGMAEGRQHNSKGWSEGMTKEKTS